MISMRKKFITSMCVCFLALMAVAGSSYYVKEGNTKSEVDLKNSKEAQNEVESETEENIIANDRISDMEEDATSYTGNVVDVGSMTVGEEETSAVQVDEVITEEPPTRVVVEENPIKGDGESNGLSTEVNAAIDSLKFNKNSEMLWPVEGNIVLEYSVNSTIYFPTLDEYKTNDSLVIQGEEYAPVIAAAKGVVTEIGDNEEIGVFIKMAIGNDYEVTYGQIINPTVEVGQTVEAGEKIACINEPTRFYEKEGYNLNFSMTKKGKSVDPMDYLIVSE